MKFAIVIPDGCADEPQASLEGRTPLEAAQTPAMDRVARLGVVGRAAHVPPQYTPGSDVANLSLMGYDPDKFFTGRAAIEAAAQGLELGPDDWAIRCNLVSVEQQVMRSFTAGQISSEEAAVLLSAAQAELAPPGWEFVPGVSYRNLLLYRGGSPAPFTSDTRATPPHDLTDQPVTDDFPRGPGSDLLSDLMARSATLFAEHPVNIARRGAGKPAATNVWLWGLGRAVTLPTFEERYGTRGAMITAVDLLRGLARLIGWERIEVPGATGYLDTDYAAKGRYAIEALREFDLVCVHVEATDEASHEGDVSAKIEALEAIDRDIVAPLHAALEAQGPYRLLVTPDHPTPCRTKTHSHGLVPLAACGEGLAADVAEVYSETTADASALVFDPGWQMMSWFMGSRAANRTG